MVATFSMVYSIAGAVAQREEFFHSALYARAPFDLGDDSQTLKDLRKEATSAGLVDGELLLAVNGVPYTGEAQIHDLLHSAD